MGSVTPIRSRWWNCSRCGKRARGYMCRACRFSPNTRTTREGIEWQCKRCLAWLPSDPEFWYPAAGLARCRACRQELNAAAQRRVRARAS